MNLAGFYEESISNGLGWRCVLFVSGCPHRCFGCHNEIAQDFSYGKPFHLEKERLLNSIKENSILRGITLSGGEPLCKENIPETLDFLYEVKRIKPNFDVWCYTGYTYEELLARNDEQTNKILNEIDVLIDGPFILELKDPDLTFKGSSNQRIIDLNRTRKEQKIVLLDL